MYTFLLCFVRQVHLMMKTLLVLLVLVAVIAMTTATFGHIGLLGNPFLGRFPLFGARFGFPFRYPFYGLPFRRFGLPIF